MLSVRFVIACRKNAPSLSAVIPIVNPALIATARVTPGGPNRNAAQISGGKIR